MSKTATRTRRAGIAALATLTMGACLTVAGPAAAEVDVNFERVAGKNRYETAIEASKKFGKSDTVVIASGVNGRFPDALTANYVAGVKDAPLLLTRYDETPEEVLDQLEALEAKNIVLVGGQGVISRDQAVALAEEGYSINRLAGENRYETAAEVIAEGDIVENETALLATGMNFPDALGAGAVSWSEEMPLAITRTTDIPDMVVEELKNAGVKKVLVLGGEDVVAKSVIEELNDAGITLEKRFAGAYRSDTSAMLAEYAIEKFGYSNASVHVASGDKDAYGVDALAGGPLSGQQEHVMLITRRDDLVGEGLIKFLGDHRATIKDGIIFGSPEGAVSQDAEDEMLAALIGSGAQNKTTGEFYEDVQPAIDEAQAGDTIHVFSDDATDALGGFTVSKDDITLEGDDADVAGLTVRDADNVIIEGFDISTAQVEGSLVGIYLDDVSALTIRDNEFEGVDNKGAGITNITGDPVESATIEDNTFRNLLQGIYANPSAEFTIESNDFVDNTVGSANDAGSTITGNDFLRNNEAIGLNTTEATVTGNSFTNSRDWHVGDYTTDGTAALETIEDSNTFDEDVVIEEKTADKPKRIEDAN